MAKIALSNSSFALVPEGTHIFKITNVVYKEDFGKLELTLETKKGLKHIERYSFVKNDGSLNEPALNAFSYLAKTALQDFDLEEIDHNDLLGRFIKADVTHDVQPNKNDPSKTVTFTRLGNKYEADGFDDDDTTYHGSPDPAPAKKVAPTPAPAPVASTEVKRKVDLAAILGRK